MTPPPRPAGEARGAKARRDRRSRSGARALFALAISTGPAAGCVPETSSLPNACLDLERSPIYGAAADAGATGPAGLVPAQELAIGSVEGADELVLCTGTLIGPRSVLTARHCGREVLWFRAVGSATARVRVSRQFPHPSRDVLLLELEPSPSFDGTEVAPLTPVLGPIGPEWVGETATLAGLGETELGSRGRRLFVEEPIVEVSADQIVVDGRGITGACAGDSGGPLLSGRPDFTGQILGVLDRGSTSCLGIDRYERVDTIRPWLEATMRAAAANPCGDLSWEGSCGGGDPTWCDGGHLVSASCAGKQTCGYDLAAGGYRCVDPEVDPCQGVGPSPECLDDVIARCASGRLVRIDCAACGLHCGRGSDGTARCE